ncbi:MAG: hypothetical protein IPG86_01350 [Chitinophagaceae bacterium]|nr:hypothetical protein [Chitinophagaceae bacterium]
MISKVPLSKKISTYFTKIKAKVYTTEELHVMIADFAKAVRTPLDAEPSEYLDWLIVQRIITAITFIDKNEKIINRYVRAGYKPSTYELALTLKPRCYLSHLSAAYIHGFVKTKPEILYVTSEGSEKLDLPMVTDPDAIASAFKGKARRSGSVYTIGNDKCILLGGKFTRQLGVIKKDEVTVTDPERTLLDAVVRPFYAGGAQTVLDIYRTAKGQISVPTLIEYLNEINFAYPYHQAIGFYLEKAGYRGKALTRLDMNYDKTKFYLDYEMNSPEFDKKWQVYFPRDLK